MGRAHQLWRQCSSILEFHRDLKLVQGLVQGLVQIATLPTTCQEENLPRLSELDALGSGKDTTGHSLFSPVAGSPTQDSTQTDLIVLPPLAPCMPYHPQHLPMVSVSQVAQSLSPGLNRPRPIEPSVLVPRISRLQMVHKFPGPSESNNSLVNSLELLVELPTELTHTNLYELTQLATHPAI